MVVCVGLRVSLVAQLPAHAWAARHVAATPATDTVFRANDLTRLNGVERRALRAYAQTSQTHAKDVAVFGAYLTALVSADVAP